MKWCWLGCLEKGVDKLDYNSQVKRKPARKRSANSDPLDVMEVAMTVSAQIAQPIEIQPPCYDANVLTQHGGLAHIVLNDQVYTLRITRAGKLILTK